MVAILAFVAFLIGLIIYIINGPNLEAPGFWSLLGLTLLALSRIWDRAIIRRDA